jgi:hypothetical protein
LNDPLKSGSNYNITNWVKIDATTDGIADTQGHNGGSGFSDLIVYIPASDFPNPNDYIFFYNLNGAHFQADVGGDAAEAGFEEWRAVDGPHHHHARWWQYVGTIGFCSAGSGACTPPQSGGEALIPSIT